MNMDERFTAYNRQSRAILSTKQRAFAVPLFAICDRPHRKVFAMSDIPVSKQRDQIQGAAILLCALHYCNEIGNKSLQITVSGSAFGAVKLPKYIIEVYPAQKQDKGSGRKQTTNTRKPTLKLSAMR